ncbi:MGT family glycosyltransferase [Haloactinospora alba]|uniref:MGT family glycosyltransferase n=2 Tax=Haloactinospora alba TaxID=405555 RepID=A0A543NNL2_9ACTN|nr:macrolide family glycosyltransferase [Haloactinospora alba]TQN33430.1 MGT family glycosyltransferase [Haloactinospora alba]
MSRRLHIAMVGIPATSHTLPSLEIIRELVARGHRVTYANDRTIADTVTATGAELVAYTSTLPTEDNAWPEDPIGAMDVFLDDAMAVLPQLRDAYGDDRPDLFLYDIAGYPARVLADNWGVPAVQLSPTYVAWGGYEEEVGSVLRQLPGADEHYAKFSAWLADNGAATTDPIAFTGRPPRALALIPRAMQPKADTVDPDVVSFVGPCFGDRGDQGDWTRPAGARNVLLVSLGSAFTRQPEFYRQCVAAFGGLPGWHVVLQIGAYVETAELGEIPDNVEVHHWVPQLAILGQADAFVTHAGMGGSSEGLHSGVPMIAVPQASDQFDNADRLVELGVARRVDTERATAETLRTALVELTSDPHVADRLAEFRREVRAEGGTQRAADLIEGMAD